MQCFWSDRYQFLQLNSLLGTDTCWLCTVHDWHHCHILSFSLNSTALQLHTHICLTACPQLHPGGSQWQGGRDFTLDLPLTALWAPLLPPWFSWPTWSSWSKPLIIPTSYPAAHTLSLSQIHIHICLTDLSVGFSLSMAVASCWMLKLEDKDLIPLCHILFSTAHWILGNPLPWLPNPFICFLI